MITPARMPAARIAESLRTIVILRLSSGESRVTDCHGSRPGYIADRSGSSRPTSCFFSLRYRPVEPGPGLGPCHAPPQANPSGYHVETLTRSIPEQGVQAGPLVPALGAGDAVGGTDLQHLPATLLANGLQSRSLVFDGLPVGAEREGKTLLAEPFVPCPPPSLTGMLGGVRARNKMLFQRF
jgi:hypothetical protein